VWNDEFDGTAIDESKWVFGGGTEADPSPRRDGFWVREAMVLDGEGHLVMRTYVKDGKVFDGEIDTSGKFEHAFGYYEARMDVNKQEGHWGAFWLMGGDWGETGKDEGALDGVEIDVMERPWSSPETGMLTNHAIHWDGYVEGANTSFASSTPGIMEGFHTFGLWRAEDMYRFYIDGIEVWATEAGGICPLPLPLILSDEVGSNIFFGAGTLDPAKLPDRTLVDYVRVWDLVAESPAYPRSAFSLPADASSTSRWRLPPAESMVTTVGKSLTSRTQNASGVPNSWSIRTSRTRVTHSASRVPAPPTAWK
jgi:hypothetical protein